MQLAVCQDKLISHTIILLIDFYNKERKYKLNL